MLDIKDRNALADFQRMVKTNQPIYPRTTVNRTPMADLYSFSNDIVMELKLDENKTSLGYVYNAKVNNKDAVLKIVEKSESNECWIEGDISGKKILINMKDGNLNGTYGNQKVDLKFDCNKPSKLSRFYNQKIRGRHFTPDYFNMSGSINGREVAINIPNSKVPTDSDAKDLLSIALYMQGLQAQTINGEVKTLYPSQSRIKQMKQQDEERSKTNDRYVVPLISSVITLLGAGLVNGTISGLKSLLPKLSTIGTGLRSLLGRIHV